MKPWLLLPVVALCAGLASAGTPVELERLPAEVTGAIEHYFPGASLISAEEERDDGVMEYEVHIRYMDIVLEVEVTENGRVTDVDMES